MYKLMRLINVTQNKMKNYHLQCYAITFRSVVNE